jgi:uncharacterized protein
MYPRLLYPILQKQLTEPEIVVISGMRQVGKTTVLKALYEETSSKNKAIFDFTNPIHCAVFREQDYDALWVHLSDFGLNKYEQAHIFIDEAQYFPEISRIAKYLYDHYHTKWWFTGSSGYYFKHQFPESLAGRKQLYELFPLTFQEYLWFRGSSYTVPALFPIQKKSVLSISASTIERLWQEYMLVGGFPSIVLAAPEKRSDMKRELFESYMRQDIQSMTDLETTREIRILLFLLISRVGSRLDIAKLANSMGVTREKIYGYLELLSGTYCIHLVSKFTDNIDRLSAGNQKLYFCDGGLIRELGNIGNGQLIEQTVFQSLHPFHEVRYYADSRGRELDFVIDKTVGVEVKEHASPRDVATAKRRSTEIGIKQVAVAVSEQYRGIPGILPTWIIG